MGEELIKAKVPRHHKSQHADLYLCLFLQMLASEEP
jgi:hypothetical protein